MLPKICLLFCMTLLLSACAQPQKDEAWPSYTEVRMKQSIADCKEDANAIVDPPHASYNMHWDNYFTMCMKTRYGYSSKEIRQMRY